MMVVGVSGHQQMPPVARAHAERVIREVLTSSPAPLVGLSSLAEGADQLFAEILLSLGGQLRAVIPSQRYASTMQGAVQESFQRLLAAADTVTTLDHDEPDERAYYEAGLFVVEHSDVLVAVWDGQPARGLGGTGDAVTHARQLGHNVVIAWPEGVRRT